MTDKKLGIAIRFIKQFDIVEKQQARREDTFSSPVDAALILAMRDSRDVPMSQKVADAWDFVHARLQSPAPDQGAGA